MKNYIITLIIVLGMLAHTMNAQDKKLAQTGMKFLSVSTDARASAFSEAVTAVDMASASSIFYNPATMASIKEFTSLSLGNVNWIADIKYMHSALAFAPFDGDYGVIGISFVSVDYGKLQGTIVASNDNGYLDVGEYSPKAFAIGIGYARALSTKFSVGGSIRYVKQDLGSSVVNIDAASSSDPNGYVWDDNSVGAVAFDFGILYKTGFKSLNFGMSVRNFSTEIKFKEEFESFQLPLTFRIGVSMDAMDLIDVDREMHSLLVSFDASHPRDYSEQIFIGGEYTFMKMFSIRAGFVSPADEYSLTYGFGVKKNLAGVNLGIDYAYQPFGIFSSANTYSVMEPDNSFGGVHRFTFNFSF